MVPTENLGKCPGCKKRVTLAKPHMEYDGYAWHTDCWLNVHPLPYG